MDFTRQPLIESVITAKEGCKLVVRSSKGSGQEEYFVDAVEVVSFGNSFFFRSQEKPKSFLVPVTDYEILEVREARMVLKNVGVDRSIKIAGGKDVPQKQQKETPEKFVSPQPEVETEEVLSRPVDKKRDRRRTLRRRNRGDESDEKLSTIETNIIPPPPLSDKPLRISNTAKASSTSNEEKIKLSTTVINSFLPPPPNLISETIDRYKDNKLFEGVFLTRNVPDASKDENKKEEKELTQEIVSDEAGKIEEQGKCSSSEVPNLEMKAEVEQDLSYRQQIHYSEPSEMQDDSFLWEIPNENFPLETQKTPYVNELDDVTEPPSEAIPLEDENNIRKLKEDESSLNKLEEL